MERRLDLANAMSSSTGVDDEEAIDMVASPRCVPSGDISGVMFVYQKSALMGHTWKKRYCVVPPNEHTLHIHRVVCESQC
jgi:hypothetical protein